MVLVYIVTLNDLKSECYMKLKYFLISRLFASILCSVNKWYIVKTFLFFLLHALMNDNTDSFVFW
jgi:hypothetical protein